MENREIVQTGWLDSLKHRLSTNSVTEKIGQNKQFIVELAIYFGAGFLIGFFFKRFARIIAFAALAFIILYVLQQLNIMVIAINWNSIEQFLGIQFTQPNADVLSQLWDWIRAHIWLTLSGIIGFYLGLKAS